MEFGEQLKKLRRQHGITQAELASAVYTTIPNLSNWENGRYMPNKITRFLLATGLRIGEALALTKADIKHGRVYVSKNLVRINKQDIVQDAPKTAAGNRAVPISRELEAELLARSGNRLFTSRQDAVARNFRTASAKLGFHVSAHILRHTYATRLEEAGVPAKVAQYLMGHATIQMTKDVYTDVQDNYIKTFDERVITFTDTRKRKD